VSADAELLCIRVDMVELKRCDAPVIAAQDARTASLGNKLSLHAAATLSDLLAAASHAAKRAVSTRHVRRDTMRCTG